MVSVWFAAGSAAALLSCLFHPPFKVQAVVFIVVSVLCLAAFKPLTQRLRQKPTPTNGDRSLGREAKVLTPVSAEETGRVRLDGVDWNARCATPGDPLAPRPELPRDRDPQHPAHCRTCPHRIIHSLTKERIYAYYAICDPCPDLRGSGDRCHQYRHRAAVDGLRHRASGQLLRYMDGRPPRQDPLRGAGGQKGQPEGAGRRLPPQPVITRDNVTMQIDTVVFFQVMDAKLYTYGVNQPIAAIESLSATTLRNIIGEMELDHTPDQP